MLNSSRHLALQVFLCLMAAGPVFAQDARLQVVGYYAERHAVSGDYPLKQLAENGAAGILTQLDYAFGKVAKKRCEVPNPDAELKKLFLADQSVDGNSDSSDSTQLHGTFHQ